jgi:hypothetical protein
MQAAQTVVLAILMLAAPVLAAPSKPTPSGPLRAYKGSDGQIIVLVAANDGKQMLVHFKNVGSAVDGTTVLYSYEDLGDDKKTVFTTKKRGSKTYRSIMLTSDGEGRWNFTDPAKTSTHFTIRYSEEASRGITIDEVLAAYRP